MRTIMNRHGRPFQARQRGFTLIELLLYTAIVGSLLVAISLFFATVLEARVKGQSIAEVEQQGTAAMEYITQTIRNADGVTAPATGATASSLTLAVPTGSLSPTIFNSAGGSLQVKEGAAPSIPLTNSKVQISSLGFKNLSRAGTPGIIQVSFTLSRINPGGRNEQDYQKTFTGTAALR